MESDKTSDLNNDDGTKTNNPEATETDDNQESWSSKSVILGGVKAHRQEPGIVIFYVVMLIISMTFAICNADTNFKVSMAWIVVGIVSSQVAMDLTQFSSPQAKAGFSAIYRIAACLIMLAIVYLA